MILMCPCIIDFIGGMDYKGEWGGGGPGHSWALKWQERSHTVVLYCDGDFNWLGQVLGGGDLTPPWRSGD